MMKAAIIKVLCIAVIITTQLGGTVFAKPNFDESLILYNLHRMRIKQQGQENVVRAQIWKTVRQEGDCTPVQQTRQRLRHLLDDSKNTEHNGFVVNAGNEEINIDDNHGTINSNVNVQIIKQGRDNPCL